jgi:hypothetical protein
MARAACTKIIGMPEGNMKPSQGADPVKFGQEATTGNPKFALGFLKGQVPPISDALIFAMSDEEADRFVDGEY